MNPDVFAQLGFPAGIAVILMWWLLKSLNGKLDRLSSALHRLSDNLETNVCPLLTPEELGIIMRERAKHRR